MIAKASIIAIGDELLYGQTQDTNSTWLSQNLNAMGVEVSMRMTVADDIEDIKAAIDICRKKSQLIITTGGLGPTQDDKTKFALSQYFDSPLDRNIKAATHIEQRINSFMKKGMVDEELLERNLRQADIPEIAEALPNARGTAPGVWIEREGLLLISLPGVPYEVQAIMNEGVWSQIEDRRKDEIHQYFITVYGIPESKLSIQLEEFENALQKETTLAYLPSTSFIVLRLTRKGSKEGFEKEQQSLLNETKPYLLVETADYKEVLWKCLQDNALQISTAESCTGGGIASLICDQSGASKIFHESLVSYANEVKIKELGVPQEVIETDGAVSDRCVRYMAEGQAKRSGADITIAVSGILGPTGGSPEKPIGLVYIAIHMDEETQVKKIKARWGRGVNKDYTINQALIFLFEILKSKNLVQP